MKHIENTVFYRLPRRFAALYCAAAGLYSVQPSSAFAAHTAAETEQNKNVPAVQHLLKKVQAPLFVLPIVRKDLYAALKQLQFISGPEGNLTEADAETLAAVKIVSSSEPAFFCDDKKQLQDFTQTLQQWTLSLNANSIESLASKSNQNLSAQLKKAIEDGDGNALAHVAFLGRRFFYTRAGSEAMNLYSSYLFERGQYLLAASQFLEIIKLQTMLQRKLGEHSSTVLAQPLSDSIKFKAVVSLRRAHDVDAAERLFKELFGTQKTFSFGTKKFDLSEIEKELSRPGPSIETLVNDARYQIFQAPVHTTSRFTQMLVSANQWLPKHIRSLETRANLKTSPLSDDDLIDLGRYIDISQLGEGELCESGYDLFTQILSPPVRLQTESALAVHKSGSREKIEEAIQRELDKIHKKEPGAARSLKTIVAWLGFPKIEYFAAKALIRLGTPSVPALLQGLKHEKDSVRKSALNVLGQVFLFHPEGFEKALPAITALFKDPVAAVREQALDSVTNIEHGEGAALSVSQIIPCLKDPEPRVRVSALTALHRATFVREVALKTLLKENFTITEDSVIDCLSNSSESVRIFAVGILRDLNSKKSVPALKELLLTETNKEFRDEILPEAIKVIERSRN